MKIYHYLVGYKSRYNYWSCSTFANWCRKKFGMVKKPGAATMEEWDDWRDTNRENSRFLYWVTETLFNKLQDIVNFPQDVYRNLYNTVHNIFISKSHLIVTGLTPGDWHDCDSRIRHGLFTLLVDFVEHEKAHMHRNAYFNDEVAKSDREDGIALLDWEIGLGEESPQQSIDAKEIKEIYIWIKDVRPARADPNKITGWSEHCANKRNSLFNKEKTEEDATKVKKMLDELHTLEQRYEDEDTEMLTRIIKIRKHLWT